MSKKYTYFLIMLKLKISYTANISKDKSNKIFLYANNLNQVNTNEIMHFIQNIKWGLENEDKLRKANRKQHLK